MMLLLIEPLLLIGIVTINIVRAYLMLHLIPDLSVQIMRQCQVSLKVPGLGLPRQEGEEEEDRQQAEEEGEHPRQKGHHPNSQQLEPGPIIKRCGL